MITKIDKTVQNHGAGGGEEKEFLASLAVDYFLGDLTTEERIRAENRLTWDGKLADLVRLLENTWREAQVDTTNPE